MFQTVPTLAFTHGDSYYENCDLCDKVWDRITGRALNTSSDVTAISCGLSNDRARIALANVSNLDPEGVVKQSGYSHSHIIAQFFK